MIVLSEASPRLEDSASARDIAAATEIARMVGFRVVHIPQDFLECEGAANALAYAPSPAAPTPAFWVGYIPSRERYRELYEAALAQNLVLPNDPTQHQLAMEFDGAYPYLIGLTPKSVIIESMEQIDTALAALSLPLFVKGTIQSVKAEGWRACVAETPDALRELVARLFRLSARSRGKVILRELVSLRHTRSTGLGFPLGREYRCFCYRGEVLVHGYYWEGCDPLRELSSSEEQEVLSLAKEAARRVPAPYLSVDIGQATDGRWWVIEVGDAQFTGASQVSLWALWGKLRERLTT